MPRLLLHICCAPDEAWVVRSLMGEYDLHCYFCNPNIAPEDEYDKRREEAQRVAETFGVPFDADDYRPESWEAAIAPVCSTPEGGARCEACFLLRLRRSAQFCRSLGWNQFTTVMSISPHKRIKALNRAGHAAGEEFGVIYVPFDFKKKNGFINSVLFSKELGLYRQDYCGCRMSKDERDRRLAHGRHPASFRTATG